MEVRVRFPPSPTGNLHVGSARTALFNFLFARKYRGKFILRIEDTDKKREVKEAYEGIYDSLKWLDLTWDEGPILQSERISIYKDHAKVLLNKGLAYEDQGAVYLRTNKDGQTKWVDLVGNKEVIVDNGTLDDFVILKSDGYPTYHLANVVDDHLMTITHVIRGDDLLSSTPKHIMLFNALGFKLPQFAHVPVILATDRSKLSKRHGAVGVLDFKKDGFLPDALVNYLALLGWTPPSGKEILSIDEVIEEFDLKYINTSPAVFDITKLEWMNGEYIRKVQSSKFKVQILEFLRDLAGGTAPDHPTEEEVERVVPLIKDRIKKLSDFIPLTDFLWEKPEYDMDVFNQLLRHPDPERVEGEGSNLKDIMSKIVEVMEKMKKPWEANTFEKTFRNLADDLGLSASQMFQIIRVAVSGQTVTPPLFECIKNLGEEETMSRIKQALEFVTTQDIA